MMRKNWGIVVGGLAACAFGLLAAGCRSTVIQVGAPTKGVAASASEAVAIRSTVGRSVRDLVATAQASGARCEVFTPDSQHLDQIPENAAGSVSIHAADGSGQDNYTFGPDGLVTRHQRSYGADYGAGVWKDVP